MSSIDQRIVEMKFDNKQFEKGIETSLHSLYKLKSALNLDEMKDGIDETAQSVKNFANQFSLLGRIGLKIKDTFADLVINRGKQLVKSLSIDQVSAGWVKYGQKTASVQTIMNATGKSIDEVNGYLDKLMWFSDETSYHFTEMVSALGTMTASGGNIEQLVPMIEGMAAATAFAGKNASEFQRVIYNLNQSYSQGYLSFIDWKSVEMAGVASAQLKQTLIDAAVALGTLKKDSKGVVRTAKRTIVTTANMGSTLNERWATKEVMEQAFGKWGSVFQEAYELVQSGEFNTASEAIESLAGKYEDVYYNAAKAAQEAKTFREAIDSVKDAVSSSWMKTFETIFGNYEEAKVLWTDLANFLWDAFVSGSKGRNKLLEEWKELGGRDELITGVSNALLAVLNIVTALKGSIAEIFPRPEATQLVALTKKVREFGDALLLLSGQKYSETSVEVPVAVNPEIEPLKRILKRDMAGDDVAQLQENLQALGYTITEFEIGRKYFGVATRDALKQFQKDFGLAVDGIYNQDIHEVLWNKVFPPTETTRIDKTTERVTVFSSVLERLKRIAKGVAAAVNVLWNGVKFIGTVVISVLKVLTPLADVLLSILAGIGDCLVFLNEGSGLLDFFSGLIAKLIGWLEPATKLIQKAADALLDFFGLGKEKSGTNDSLKMFERLWTNIQGKLKDWGVWDALTAAWDRISAAAAKLGEAFRQLWSTIKTSWGNLKTTIGKRLPSLFGENKTGDTNLGARAITAIGVGLSKAIDFLTSIVQNLPTIRSKISEFTKTAWDFLTSLWEKLKVSDRFGDAATKISDFFHSIWKSISEFFSGGSRDAVDEDAGVEKKLSIFSKIAATLKAGWERVSAVVTWVYNGVTTLWEKVGGFSGIISNAWGLTALFGAIASVKLLRSITGTIKTLTTIGTKVPAILEEVPKFIANAGGVFESMSDYFKDQRRKSKMKSVAAALKDFAKAALLLVAAIYILGKMDPDELKQGAIAMLGIAAALAILQVGCAHLSKKYPNAQMQFRGILSLAFAVLTLAATMKLINKMSLGDYLKGLARVSGMTLALRLIMLGFAKFRSTNVSIKGILSVSFALIILTGVMKLVNALGLKTYLKGLARVSGMILALRLIMLGFGKFKHTNISIKGLIGLSLSLLVLVGVMKRIVGMKLKEIGVGLLGLSALMLALALFTRSMAKIEVTGFGKKALGLIGIVLALRILAGTMAYIGGLDIQTYVLGLAGLTIVLATLKGLAKAAAQIDLKKALGVIIMCVGVAALMHIFTRALRSVDDIDQGKIKWFSVGIVGMLASLSQIIRWSSKNRTFKRVFTSSASIFLSVLSIVGAIGLVIAAVGALKQVPGFQEVMNGGAASIGEMVGSFLGGMNAAQIKAFNSITTDLDEDSLDRALKLASALSDFEKKLPATSGGNDLLSFLKKSPLGQFSSDMGDFATGLTSFAQALNGIAPGAYDDLVNKANKAVEMVDSLAVFASAKLPGNNIDYETGPWNLIKRTKLETFASDLEEFAGGFSKFAETLDTLELEHDYKELNRRAKKAVKMTEPVAVLASTKLSGDSFDYETGPWGLIKRTKLETFSNDLKDFGGAFPAFAEALDGLKLDNSYDDLVKKAEKAVEMVKPVAVFASTHLTDDKNVVYSDGPFNLIKHTKIGTFSEDMVSFGAGFSSFAKGLNGIKEESYEGLENKAQIAISIAKALAEFTKEEVPEPNMAVVERTGIFSWTSESVTKLFAGDMTALGDAFNKFAIAISSIENPPTTEQVSTAIACAQLVAAFFSGLPDYNIEADKNKIATFISGDTSINTFMTKLVDFAKSIKDAANELSGIASEGSTAEADLDLAAGFLERILRAMSGLLTAANGIVLDSDSDNLVGVFDHVVSNITEIGDQIVDLSDKLKWNEVDTVGVKLLLDSVSRLFDSVKNLDSKTWLSGLDADDIATDLSEFIDSVGSSFDLALSSLETYKQSFVDAGNGISESLSEITTEFVNVGSRYALGVIGGYQWGAELQPFTDSTQLQLNAVTAFTRKFRIAGQDFAVGLAKGLDDRKYKVIEAANVLAKSVLDEVREVFDEHSPSKEANEIGRYFGKGLAGGLKDGSTDTTRAAQDMALDALHGVQDTLLALSNLIADGIDVDPVIRPVVDLSNVTAGAQAIGGMLGGSQTVSVDTSTRLSSSAARAASASAMARRTAETQTRSSVPQSAGDQVNVTGNTFVIRDEQDIYSLASEIATLLYRQQRSVGAH